MLTFEKIRELERLERDNKDLVNLPDNFIEDVSEYLSRKRQSTDERELKNIESTLKRLFEHRERKLLEMVIYSAKTDVHVDNIAKHEKETFEMILSIFRDYRNNILEKMEIVEQKPVEIQVKKEVREYFRVKRTLKSFVGPDMKVYQLKENDTIEKGSLPKMLNDLLIKEGIIEKVVE